MSPRSTWLVRKHHETGRWARYGRQKWQRHGLEMVGTDVHTVHPAGTVGFSADPQVLQEHLRSELSPGTPLTLLRYEEAEVPSATSDHSRMAPPTSSAKGIVRSASSRSPSGGISTASCGGARATSRPPGP